MVNDYLKLNKGVEKTERKKPSRKYFTGDSAKIASLPSLDYVFDIYHWRKFMTMRLLDITTRKI